MASGKTIEHATIKGLAWDIAADIYFPEGFDSSAKYPVVVCIHPIGSVKEQTPGSVYGTKLADEGFVAVAYDASFQGASGGEPRFIEDPHPTRSRRQLCHRLPGDTAMGG